MKSKFIDVRFQTDENSNDEYGHYNVDTERIESCSGSKSYSVEEVEVKWASEGRIAEII